MEPATINAAADEELLASLRAQYIPDVIVLLQGDLVTWLSPNAKDALGWSAQEVMGMPLDALMHDDDRQAVRRATAAARGGTREGLVARTMGGAPRPVTVEVLLHPRSPADDAGDVVATLRPIDQTVAFRESATAAATAPRALADRAGDVFFVVDGTGTVIEVGPVIQEKLGWEPEEFLGSRPENWVNPDDMPVLEAYRREVHAGTARGSIEMRVRARGGGLRWVRATALMVRDGGADDPASTRVMVSWRDIDSLVRDKRFAEREAGRLRAFMDMGLDPLLILTPLRDAQGAIVDFVVHDANEGAATHLRWPRDHLMGAHLLEEFPDIGAGGLMDAFVQCAESGEPVDIHDLALPNDLFGESRLYHLRGHRMDGQLMLKWHDTTPASTARNELAMNEALFRAIATASGDALVVVDEGHVAWASPGAMALGLDMEAHMATVLSSLVAPDSVGQVDACCLLLDGAHPYRGRWHRPDGPPLIACANPLPGPRPRGVVTLIAETWSTRAPRPGTTGT